ncbi:MAG: cupin domain-containing protein [Betaproteobacteria bacterium]|nr:cupin domain-containing protein [Betaproteobacteria bacterium]
MNNYSKVETGQLNKLDQYKFAPEGLPAPIVGKLFLGDLVGLTSMDVSLNKDAPNTGMHFFHSHRNNEELYIFLKGNGEMMIDEDRFTVTEGSIVKVNPHAQRAWWNTGNEDLYYVVIQAQANGLKAAGLNDADLGEEKVPWI